MDKGELGKGLPGNPLECFTDWQDLLKCKMKCHFRVNVLTTFFDVRFSFLDWGTQFDERFARWGFSKNKQATADKTFVKLQSPTYSCTNHIQWNWPERHQQSGWGTCTLHQRPWKNDVIAPLGGITSAGDPRPLPHWNWATFFVHFPFWNAEIVLCFGVISGDGQDRNISFHRLPPKKTALDQLKCSTTCVRRECMDQALRRREGRLFGCAKFSPPSQNFSNLDLFPREEDWSLTQMKSLMPAQTYNHDRYMYSVDGADRPAPVECDRGRVTESFQNTCGTGWRDWHVQMQPSISAARRVGDETSLDFLNQVKELTVRLLEKGETELKLGEELEELRHGKQASQQHTCSRLSFHWVWIHWRRPCPVLTRFAFCTGIPLPFSDPHSMNFQVLLAIYSKWQHIGSWARAQETPRRNNVGSASFTSCSDYLFLD